MEKVSIYGYMNNGTTLQLGVIEVYTIKDATGQPAYTWEWRGPNSRSDGGTEQCLFRQPFVLFHINEIGSRSTKGFGMIHLLGRGRADASVRRDRSSHTKDAAGRAPIPGNGVGQR